MVIVRSLVDFTGYVIDRRLLTEAQSDVRFGNWWINMEKWTIKWTCGMKDLFEVDRDFNPDFENVKLFYVEAEDESIFLQEVISAIKGDVRTEPESGFLIGALLDSANEMNRVIRQIVNREQYKGGPDE